MWAAMLVTYQTPMAAVRWEPKVESPYDGHV